MERESYLIREDTIFIFEINELCNKENKNLNQYELQDIQQDNLNGYLSYSINNNFVTSARILKINGDIIIKLKKLDFYVNE